MSEVVAIGDSHSLYMFGRVKGVRVRWLGPVTMHRVGRDGCDKLFEDQVRERGFHVNIKPASTVVFVFGEIDVRLHLLRVADASGEPLDAVIDRTVSRYVEAVRAYVQGHGHRAGVICKVVPVPAPAKFIPDSEYGPLEGRVLARRKLNAAIDARTAGTGLKLIEIPRRFEAARGTIKPHYSDGNYHLAPGCTRFVADALSALLEREFEFEAEPQPVRAVNALLRRMPLGNRYDVLQGISPFPYDVMVRG